jgi:hypothetical protein
MTANLGAVQIKELITGGMGFVPGTDGDRRGASEILAGVCESLRQTSGVSSLAAGTIAGSGSDRAPKGTISC